MSWLRKIHNRRQPAGLEWVIFKKLPRYLLAATLIPAMMSLFIRLWPLDGSISQISRIHSRIDIWSISLAITAWTAIFTVAIGCIVVIIMKGPAYVADAYKLQDSNRPRSSPVRDDDD